MMATRITLLDILHSVKLGIWPFGIWSVSFTLLKASSTLSYFALVYPRLYIQGSKITVKLILQYSLFALAAAITKTR